MREYLRLSLLLLLLLTQVRQLRWVRLVRLVRPSCASGSKALPPSLDLKWLCKMGKVLGPGYPIFSCLLFSSQLIVTPLLIEDGLRIGKGL